MVKTYDIVFIIQIYIFFSVLNNFYVLFLFLAYLNGKRILTNHEIG
jgi:hypothetical protein